MLTKTDCLTILTQLEDTGIDVDEPMRELLIAKELPKNVLQFIVKHKGMEVANFYEVLRQKHNKNKSPLYTNILKELDDENECVITLSSLLTQIFLFAKNIEEQKVDFFLDQVRAAEISRVLTEYTSTRNFENGFKLLKAIKTDLLVLEFLADKRELN